MRKKPKIVATIESRMGSSRLPGKVLMSAIDNISMLEFMVNRIKKLITWIKNDDLKSTIVMIICVQLLFLMLFIIKC